MATLFLFTAQEDIIKRMGNLSVSERFDSGVGDSVIESGFKSQDIAQAPMPVYSKMHFQKVFTLF